MARPLVATKPPQSSTADAAVEGPRRRRPSRRRALVGWLYATPTAVMVGLFFLVPLVLVGWMSLHRWPLLGEPDLNFPDNYTGVADNELIGDAAWFTAKYTVVITVLLFVVAFAMALLVQRRRRGVGFFRTAFILPMAVGFASASLLFLGFLSDEIGPVNSFLESVGLIDGYTSWTSGSPNSALGSAVLLVLWRFAGFMMLILLTGLQSIPVELYEAARVDGAGRWRSFLSITLPGLAGVSLVLILLQTIWAFGRSFTAIFVMTGGGPAGATETLVIRTFLEGFRFFHLEAASALGVLIMLISAVFTVLYLWSLGREQ
jgi:multiple sugar transport system permease protein